MPHYVCTNCNHEWNGKIDYCRWCGNPSVNIEKISEEKDDKKLPFQFKNTSMRK